MDRLSPDRRSALMARIRGTHTVPEVTVRRLIHRLGYRFRLHRRDLPGSPDIVFPARKKAIFVHGCFWHGHGCKWGKLPKTKLDYWAPKITANRHRDSRKAKELRKCGWTSLTVWQCELRSVEKLIAKIISFLEA